MTLVTLSIGMVPVPSIRGLLPLLIAQEHKRQEKAAARNKMFEYDRMNKALPPLVLQQLGSVKGTQGTNLGKAMRGKTA